MIPEDALTVAACATRICCGPCAVELMRNLATVHPGIGWLELARAADPDSELVSYLDDPEGYQA